MAKEKKEKEDRVIERFFEQPPEAISHYSDMAQVISTGNEIVLQFYETIPGPPVREGHVNKVRTRLRATITVSFAHARNIGKLILENIPETKK